jgi:hypothetical protein
VFDACIYLKWLAGGQQQQQQQQHTVQSKLASSLVKSQHTAHFPRLCCVERAGLHVNASTCTLALIQSESENACILYLMTIHKRSITHPPTVD